MLSSSPLEAYGVAHDGPSGDLSSPWGAALRLQGLIRGYGRTFNSPERPGGFSLYAYEFPTQRSASSGAAAAYRVLVCEMGADPFIVPEQRGIGAGIRISDRIDAWWVHRRRVIQVNYSLSGESEDHRSAALGVIHAAWEQVPRSS